MPKHPYAPSEKMIQEAMGSIENLSPPVLSSALEPPLEGEEHPAYPGLRRIGHQRYQHKLMFDGQQATLIYPARCWAVAIDYYVDTERNPERGTRRFGKGNSMHRVVKAYLEHVKATCAAQRYCDMRSTMKRWMEVNGKRNVRSLTHRDGEAFLQFERNRGLAPNTINQAYQRIRAFASWILDEEYIERDIGRRMVRPKRELAKEDKRRYVPPDVLGQILSTDRLNKRPDLQHAMWAMLGLGLRWSECWHFGPHRVKESTEAGVNYPHVQIKGAKGGRERAIPLADENVLDAVCYLALSSPRNKLKQPDIGQAQTVVTKACKELGLPRFTFHALRHSAITRWLNVDKVPLHDAQRWAGHANPSQTVEYYCAEVVPMHKPEPLTPKQLKNRLLRAGIGVGVAFEPTSGA